MSARRPISEVSRCLSTATRRCHSCLQAFAYITHHSHDLDLSATPARWHHFTFCASTICAPPGHPTGTTCSSLLLGCSSVHLRRAASSGRAASQSRSSRSNRGALTSRSCNQTTSLPVAWRRTSCSTSQGLQRVCAVSCSSPQHACVIVRRKSRHHMSRAKMRFPLPHPWAARPLVT